MELNDLVIFQKVAECGSISKAAVELNYVQSNVTARIKRLEKELHTPLFSRHKRGVVLNSEGERLLEYAKEITSKVEELKQSFQDHADVSGMLKIGIVETVNALPGILSSFNDAYPNVEVSLMAGVTDQLIQDVLDMKLDGAFVTGPIRHPNVEQLPVVEENLVLVSKRDSFTMDQLTTTPFLLYHKGCGYRGRLESWMKVEGIIPRKIMEFGTFGTIIGSVSAGIGVTVIPKSSVTNLISQEIVDEHQLPEPYCNITTIFIWRKDAYITRTLAHFIEEIKLHAEQLAENSPQDDA
ncbi:LysR family transcriptional regulator [Paenibacillus sp. FSL W7-1287]|uniref:LysR family transcriptional regulator n=1 Tax=Paenibacillus sp. FSL W7-1287 TaxID=2954538 RepID=UPI0030FBAF5B